MNWLIIGIGLVAGLYLALALIMFMSQRKLMYFPNPQHVAPASIGLDCVAEHIFGTVDGESIVTWYGAARPGRATVLYFHGNAGHLHDRSDRIRAYRDAGLGVMIMAYRGYSGSSGKPSETNNIADALAAHDELTRLGIKPERLVLYGESLGTGVAVQVAARKPVAGVILDAPYTSLSDVAQRVYPWLPVRLALVDRYDSMAHIRQLKAPLLIMHGERDAIVPVDLGRELFAAAREPKRLVVFPEAGHTDHYLHGSFEIARDFIGEIERGELVAGKAGRTAGRAAAPSAGSPGRASGTARAAE